KTAPARWTKRRTVGGSDRRAGYSQARIVRQSPQHEQRVHGLDAVFLDLDFVVGPNAMVQQEIADIAGNFQAARKQRVAELFLEVAVDVQVSALGIDQDAARVVVEVKRHMQALIRLLDPLRV